VAQNIQFNPYRHAADFDLSPSGAMVWYGRVNSQASQLTWYDFDGRELGKLGELGPTVMMNFSPDGRRLVTCDRTDHFDLGMYDVGSGVRTRFTLGPAPAAYPVFSRDGKTVFYGDGVGTILARASDGSGEARTLISQPTVSMWTGPETPDGSGIIIMSQRPKTAFDIGVLPLAPGAQIRDLIAGPGSQSNPAFSPDGRWLAYDTDESGRSEVVVVRYPSLSGRWQVSTQGGNTPLWMPDGRSIVYGTDDAHLMRTGVDGRGEGLVVETTERIFGGKTLPGPIMIAPDGKRILVIVPANSAASQSINLVTDWRQLVGE
jgi:Tol biopolymer transport system component